MLTSIILVCLLFTSRDIIEKKAILGGVSPSDLSLITLFLKGFLVLGFLLVTEKSTNGFYQRVQKYHWKEYLLILASALIGVFALLWYYRLVTENLELSNYKLISFVVGMLAFFCILGESISWQKIIASIIVLGLVWHQKQSQN